MTSQKQLVMTKLVAYFLLVVSGLYLLAMLLAGFQNQDVSDFGTYYNATAFAFQERMKSPYTNHAPYPPYYYPPPSIILFSPLLLFSQETAKVFFSLVSLTAVVASVVLVIRLAGDLLDWQKALLLAAATFYYPLWFTVEDGQINAVLLFLVTGAFYAYRQRRDYLAGLLLGLAAIFKITPLLLVGYFLVRKRYKVFVGAAAVFLAVSFLAEILLQPGINWFYWRYIVDDVSKQGGASYRDQSLNAFLLKVGFLEPLWDNYLIKWLTHPFFSYKRIVSLVNYLLVGCLTAVVFWVSWRRRLSEGEVLLDYSLLLMVAVLGSGLAWFHQYTILLFPLLVALVSVMKMPSSLGRVWWSWWLSVSYILMAVSLERQLKVAERLDGWQKAVMFYGAVILGGILVYFRRRFQNERQGL